MSNYSSTQIFGDQVGIITARCMVMNINGIPLFHFIDHKREIHNLPAIVNNNMQILDNLIEINYYSLSNRKYIINTNLDYSQLHRFVGAAVYLVVKYSNTIFPK